MFLLASEGKALKISKSLTGYGVPVYCVMFVLLLTLLDFLYVRNSSTVVLQWFIILVRHIAIVGGQ